jgi:hypothetical protein
MLLTEGYQGLPGKTMLANFDLRILMDVSGGTLPKLAT